MASYANEMAIEDCWNVLDSRRTYCVHCGCCSSDETEQTTSRIKALKGHLEYWKNYKICEDDDVHRIRKESIVQSYIESCERQIQLYEDILKEITNG